MTKTRGSLEAAKIYEVDKKGNPTGGLSISCMFNPFEYTVSKANTFNEKPGNDKDTPQAEFSKAGPQSLKLILLFDTYETKKDVSEETNNLWKFMEAKNHQDGSKNEKNEPPQVAFEWGVFKFVSFITNMTHKFTMFLPNGTPVRASVDVTFTQYTDVNDYPKQNPTSGGETIERIWQVRAGDRVDTIAAEVYGDATQWRAIAEHNNIVNPLRLQPGQELSIPLN